MTDRENIDKLVLKLTPSLLKYHNIRGIYSMFDGVTMYYIFSYYDNPNIKYDDEKNVIKLLHKILSIREIKLKRILDIQDS